MTKWVLISAEQFRSKGLKRVIMVNLVQFDFSFKIDSLVIKLMGKYTAVLK